MKNSTIARLGNSAILFAILLRAPTSGRLLAAEIHEPVRLKVSDSHRFLVTSDGKPFFWLGDTAWELFHRLNRDETERYLTDRAAKGFTVIQAVALAELDGVTVPNAQGHLPLIKEDLHHPDVKGGPDNDYWDEAEWVIALAATKGLYVGLLPMWGKPCPADPSSCERCGRFIGERFQAHLNLIWILGGDRPARTKNEQDCWRAMAKGITLGVSGREDDATELMTYHTFGPTPRPTIFTTIPGSISTASSPATATPSSTGTGWSRITNGGRSNR